MIITVMVNSGLSCTEAFPLSTNTFIGRSGDGKRGRGGATRESGTHYGGRVCNRLANLRACLRRKRMILIEPTSGYGLRSEI